MPLTIVHSAIVIPLQNKLKNHGVLSALVIGSLMPDVAYFPHMSVTRLQGHSFAGMFWFCFPAGLITYYLFHNFLKEPLISLLPESVARKLPEASINKVRFSNVTLFFPICFSLWIGTATHILWDSFTHEDGFIETVFPVFQAHLFSILTYDVIVYKILQHASTISGTMFLGYWIFQWYVKSKTCNAKSARLPIRPRIFLIGSMVLILIVASLITGSESSNGQSGLLAFQLFYKNMIVTVFVAASFLFFLYSLIYQVVLIFKNKSYNH